ncbi:hypothetical protein OA105_01960 [Prochlorococcus sp. AH-736-B08]|nr:hypothetical protein [Prochlorococcus sp. AH-736-B08]
MSFIKPNKCKQFNEVFLVKVCKNTHLFDSLSNPQARRLLKEVN